MRNNAVIDGNNLVFDCGCKFLITNNDPNNFRCRVTPEIDIVPLDCKATWQLFEDGNTKGIFQLETRLGQHNSKLLKPENIEHSSGLIAILRPGPMESIIDGKNITSRYIDRKNGDEPIEYFHTSLEDILQDSYGLLIYQEHTIKIVKKLAGFNAAQSELLRKGLGKKKVKIINELKDQFIEGCEKTGIVTREEAETIFQWIHSGSRYLFNRSHSIGYALNGYIFSAYLKAHFPVSFFASSLFHAKDKAKTFEEVKLLVNNAKMMGVDINPPDFRQLNQHFKRVQTQPIETEYNQTEQNKIVFGFADIKGIGENSINDVIKHVETAELILGRKKDDWQWIDFLIYLSPKLKSTVVVGMLESGALDYFKVPRQQMLYEYNQVSVLSDKEIAWIQQNCSECKSLKEVYVVCLAPYDSGKKLKRGEAACANAGRVAKVRNLATLLNNPPYSLNDTPEWISAIEEARLGASLTTSILDGCKNSGQANMTCEEFLNTLEKKNGIFMAVQIEEIKTHIDSKNNEMAFMTVGDGNLTLDCVVFSKDWEVVSNKGVCFEGNTVMISGGRSDRSKDSFVIKNMWQLT